MTDKSLCPLTFGFDIGIASVGWCVLGETRIIDLGVRCFDKAETAKEGESLNLTRRMARLMRRRLRRRAWRLTKLARVLRHEGLIDTSRYFHRQHPTPASLWQLRVDGLNRCLTNEEWARVIYHLCKHRGFHWTSRADKKKAEGDNKGEGGKVKQGLAGTNKLMVEKGYRSAAEMVLSEFPEAQRNKQGNYGKALSRVLLGDELALIFQRQRELGNPHAAPGFEAAVLGNGDRKSGLFWLQKPSLAGADLLKMLGKCTFEKSEFRAPKASFTAERHVWLTRLNNLRIVVDGNIRPLNEPERETALPLPYEQASDLTYKQLHAALVKKGLLPESFEFQGLRANKDKDPKDEKLVKLPAWQELRQTLKKAGLETEWRGMAGAAMDGRPQLLDEISWVLSVFKDDDEVAAELAKLPLPNAAKMIDALLDIRFDKFHALSLKALRSIVPQMESGLRYDEACAAAGYHHSQIHPVGEGEHKYLPPLYSGRDKTGRMVFSDDMDIPNNPVVLRSLNQARKIINALIRRYGSPTAVHIEMARDLSRPLDERRKVEKEQIEYRDRNEIVRQKFEQTFGFTPDGRTMEKYRLYEEQMGKCVYSGEGLDIDRVVHDKTYAEVDHALPYSRSYDDGKNNKVLVLAKENRDKGNRTAYEYLTSFPGGESSERWQQFVAFVESNKAYRLAKRTRLLRKNFDGKDAEEFRERNLNDTRFICRFFKNYMERYLKLEDGSEAKRCVVLSGQLTSFLRARWGLIKVRSASDRHHALDAAVVAACSHSMVKRLADYSRQKELRNARDGFVNIETGEIADPVMHRQLQQHFPEPWPHFRNELEARLNTNDPAELRAKVEALGSYPNGALEAIRPLFVSRAPQRRNSGALHQETIRSSKRLDQEISYVKVPIQKLRLSDIDRIVGASDPRNSALIELLRRRLESHDGDGKKAFAEPLHKPSARGTAPVVRTVKVATTQKSGMRIRGGVADLGEMHHVDIFRCRNRIYVEPAYEADASQRVKGPNVPEDAEFMFALAKNDYVEITLGNTTYRGYFVMYENDGRLTLRAHDQPKPDKEYFRKGITSAENIKKFHIDVLGNVYPAPRESRCGLA